MAKLLGPDFISLQVTDLAASRAFYADTLGFKVDSRFDTADFVLFDTNSIPFGLAQATMNMTEGANAGWGVTLWIDCDNVDELQNQLKAARANIVKAPYDSPFGRAMVFEDPDGYRITANQNPWERFPLGGRSKSE